MKASTQTSGSDRGLDTKRHMNLFSRHSGCFLPEIDFTPEIYAAAEAHTHPSHIPRRRNNARRLRQQVEGRTTANPRPGLLTPLQAEARLSESGTKAGTPVIARRDVQ